MLRSRTPAAFSIKTLTLNSPYWIIQIGPPAQNVSWRSGLAVLRSGLCASLCTLANEDVNGRGCCAFLLLFFLKKRKKKGKPTSVENVNKFSEDSRRRERGGGNKEELCRHERDERGQQGGSPALCVYDWMRWVRGFHTHLWMLILSRAQAGLIFTARLNEGAD